MATFTKKNWITGETITDTKLNNEKGYYLLEFNLDGFELQVGTLTDDDLLNIIAYNGTQCCRVTYWKYDSNMYTCSLPYSMTDSIIEYHPSTGILKTVDNGGVK